MKTSCWLAATLTVLLPRLAVADPVSGPYISLGAGVDFLQNQTFKLPPGYSKRGYSFDPGPAVAAGVGYGLGNGVRLEIEGDYANNHVRGFKVAQPARGGGHEQQYGGFANAFYDFDLGLPVSPYLGVGVGYQRVELDDVNGSVRAATVGPGHSNSGGSFAYQGMAGVSYAVGAVPGLSLTAEYRFVGVDAPSIPRNVGGSVVNASIENIFNHQLLFGLRYAFGTAVPLAPQVAPTPPVSVATTKTYLVFFDWDRADLTARARQIVASAAADAGSARATRIEVSGHADLSGGAAYNQPLSIRRAQAVAAELVRDGVPGNEIDIQGFGDKHPLVPTAAGVREPQNRRVEIVLRQ